MILVLVEAARSISSAVVGNKELVRNNAEQSLGLFRFLDLTIFLE